jgi:drug/metabolite transporter (DMT)-like permease
MSKIIISDKSLAYLRLTAVIVIWGSIFHVAKYLVSDTDIFSVAFIRFFISSIVLLLIFYGKNRHLRIFSLNHNLILLVLTGIFGGFGYTSLFFLAETLISANQVAILFSLAPCLTVLFSRIYLKQTTPVLAYLGILVALCGTIAVISHGEQPSCPVGFSSWNLLHRLSLGQIAALGTACFMAIYNVLTRKLAMRGVDTLTITTVSTVVGTCLLFINFVLFAAPAVHLVSKSITFWLAMLYTAVMATALCYKWYSDAISKIGVSQAAVFLNGIPLAAVLIGIPLGDSLTLWVALAGLVIVLGVIITNYSINLECTKKVA